MEKKRCQVCDGPIVNGRCKLCGMPYRNDETLYHLNENRSDHYRHATSRARAIMRQEEIPLGDKKPGAAAAKSYKQTTAGTSGAGSKYGQKNGGVNTGAGYKQLTGTGSTYKSTSTAKTGNKTSAGSYNAKSRQTTAGTYSAAGKKGGVYTQKPVKKKKGSLLGWLILIVVICSTVPEIRNVLRDEVAPVIEREFGNSFGSSASYILTPEDAMSVGNDDWDEIEPGQYVASCENGYVSFMILGDDGESGTMTVSEGEDHRITLNDGDMIGIISSESQDSRLLLTAR